MRKNYINRAILISFIALFTTQLIASISYPGTRPQIAKQSKINNNYTLNNNLIYASWEISSNNSFLATIKNIKDKKTITAKMPLFSVTLASGVILDSFNMKLVSKKHSKYSSKAQIIALFEDSKTKTKVKWSAELKDGSNYIRQGVVILPNGKDLLIKRVVLLDLPVVNAQKTGTVNGSPIVAQNFFFGFEHPMAGTNVKNNTLVADWVTPITVIAGVGQKFNSVIGVYPENQLRRAFSYYLERERARPYRPYLHYNSWFDLNIDNGHHNQMTSKQAENSITLIGEELVIKRKVHMDGFVLDDGWDYHDTIKNWDKNNDVWGFNSGFPNGFTETKELAFDKYEAGIGVWLSPFGGYGGECRRRVQAGNKFYGYELAGGLFNVAGEKYGAHFTKVCLEMMDKYKVNYFKFDRMGGNSSTGHISGAAANNILAVLRLTEKLRAKDKNVYINATVGTWPSPFWMMFADSIWRQGDDTGLIGGRGRGVSLAKGINVKEAGNDRERWISYRDGVIFNRITKGGSLYPLNSLMFHGVTIGDRSIGNIQPRGDAGAQSIKNEARMAFAGGSQLQELYITPRLLTRQNWDDIAEAINWSHKNTDVLIDTHWIGGNPAKLDPYGYASWNTKKAVMVIRNPRNIEQTFDIEVGSQFELPVKAPKEYLFKPAFKDQRPMSFKATSGKIKTITLKPFEVLVFDVKKI
jgi:hypothetical protein